MMIEKFLRNHPYLKPVRAYNLYERFLKESNGSMLLLFNIFRDRYELHSLKSFRLEDESLNVVVPDELLTGWLLTDYLANDINKFGLEVQGEREVTNTILDNSDGKGLELLTTRALKTVETMVGREI